jgi:hypothetical protein
MNSQRQKWWLVRGAGIATVVLAACLCAGTAVAGIDSGPGIWFDAGFGWSTMSESMYSSARWSDGDLVNVEEYWDLRFKGGGGPAFGAGVFYRFNRYLSLELEGRGLYTYPSISTEYNIYWDWDDGRSLWNAYRGYRHQSPSMRTMVGSLNLVTHLTDQGPVRPFLSFGFSAFDTSIRGVYDTAYAYTYYGGDYQYLDFEYPLIDFRANTSSMGFNAGVGGDVQINPRMAFTFMFKYYYSEKEYVNLQPPAGFYPELSTFAMEVNPSFWITTGGIKFMF